MTPFGWADVPVIYCLTNHHIIQWIKIAMIIYFAHEYEVWLGLDRGRTSLFCVMRAGAGQRGAEGATSKVAHSHGCRVWLPNQTLGQTLSSFPYGPLCRVFGLPYGMVAGFQKQGLKRQKGSGSCQLLRTRSGNRHGFVFALKSTHQVVMKPSF